MVTSEHPEVIEGRRWFITTDVLDSEEADEDGSIDNDGASSDEEDESGLVEVGVITGVDAAETEEEAQQSVESNYLSSYILKTPTFLMQGLK